MLPAPTGHGDYPAAGSSTTQIVAFYNYLRHGLTLELAMRPQASICGCPLIQTDNVASVIPRSPTILGPWPRDHPVAPRRPDVTPRDTSSSPRSDPLTFSQREAVTKRARYTGPSPEDSVTELPGSFALMMT